MDVSWWVVGLVMPLRAVSRERHGVNSLPPPPPPPPPPTLSERSYPRAPATPTLARKKIAWRLSHASQPVSAVALSCTFLSVLSHPSHQIAGVDSISWVISLVQRVVVDHRRLSRDTPFRRLQVRALPLFGSPPSGTDPAPVSHRVRSPARLSEMYRPPSPCAEGRPEARSACPALPLGLGPTFLGTPLRNRERRTHAGPSRGRAGRECRGRRREDPRSLRSPTRSSRRSVLSPAGEIIQLVRLPLTAQSPRRWSVSTEIRST
jgi:hypothetical protein